MLFDTHCHLNFPVFNENREKIIKKCLNNNIFFLNVGTNFETSKKAVEISEEYKNRGVFSSIALHPLNLKTALLKNKIDPNEGSSFEKNFDFKKYENLARSSKKVVAIGEIGLDYYYLPKTKIKRSLFKEKQKELFNKELYLAKKLNLPVILHCRLAHDDLLSILKKAKIRGVIHSFVGTRSQLKEYLNLGFYVGFNGIIFKKIERIDFEDLIRYTPLERILLETDSPYLAPPSFPEKLNTPLSLPEIAKKISTIKNISFEKISEITTQNAIKCFKINREFFKKI